MKGIALLDMISFLVLFAGMLTILFSRKHKMKVDIRMLIIALLFLMMLYNLSLFVEWYGLTDALDPYEDLTGALIPMMWVFLFYGFIQKVNSVDLQESVRQIRRINRQLIRAKEKAEESDKLKSVFLANMSHEIRTPMNGILGFAEILKKSALSKEKQMEYIDIIQQSGNRMLNIINDLVDISKIESGQLEISLENTSIKDLLHNQYLFFKPEADQRGLLFSYLFELQEEENRISTDKTRVTQVLSNLIKNALKYTDKGRIDFGCIKVGNTIEFFVSDTGIGIPQEYQEMIFERFRQIGKNTPSGNEGCGLGLAISKAFVEKLGGRIWVSSKPGSGSTFYFTLPCRKPGAEKRNQAARSKILDNLTKKIVILITEDDEISYLYFSSLLLSEKVSVLRAENGQEAINICRNHPEITMVLMDIKMPVMNGIEAIRQIKKIRKDIPVIVQTAFASGEDRKLALDAGGDGYLTKPVNEEELFEYIRKFGV